MKCEEMRREKQLVNLFFYVKFQWNSIPKLSEFPERAADVDC